MCHCRCCCVAFACGADITSTADQSAFSYPLSSPPLTGISGTAPIGVLSPGAVPTSASKKRKETPPSAKGKGKSRNDKRKKRKGEDDTEATTDERKDSSKDDDAALGDSDLLPPDMPGLQRHTSLSRLIPYSIAQLSGVNAYHSDSATANINREAALQEVKFNPLTVKKLLLLITDFQKVNHPLCVALAALTQIHLQDVISEGIHIREQTQQSQSSHSASNNTPLQPSHIREALLRLEARKQPVGGSILNHSAGAPMHRKLFKRR